MQSNRLGNNEIGVELGTLHSLTDLNLDHNFFSFFPHQLPVSITRLRLSKNRISRIDEASIQHLKNLEFLYLDKNNLTNGSIKDSILKSLIHLRHLDWYVHESRRWPFLEK